jgi:hypothetical protein
LKIKTEFLKTVTITYVSEEKIKAIDYCIDKGYVINSTIDPGVIVASKVIPPEEIKESL